MAMDHRFLRPKKRRPTSTPAEPSLNVTVQGAEATKGQSVVTAAGPDDTTTDNFGNSVSADSGGTLGGFVEASGWQNIGGIGLTVTFEKVVAELTDPPSLASGGGSVGGTAGTDAVTEVAAINFGGATGGTIRISGSDQIPWDADASAVESAIEATTGRGFSVTGSNGVFQATDDSSGPQTDLEITENLLTL